MSLCRIALLAAGIAVTVLTSACGGKPAPPAGGHTAQRTVLCTTFPIFQITRNVARGRDGLEVQLMLPSQLGCPHNYTLTPQDMQELARADVLVINGLGMEEFLGAPLKRANEELTIVDSSAGIEETLQYTTGHEHNAGEAHKHHAGHDAEEGEEHDHHHHEGVNPHLFASPRMAAKLAMNIAAGLGKADPAGKDLYTRNARAYAETLNKLADEMADLGKRLKNNRIVEPHGVFDYLARDAGLEILAVMQAHGQEPSAAEMARLAKTIREKKVGAIFTEPQYPDKVGKALARETGVPVGMLDPAASGPEDAPPDYYETVMRENMKTLETTLGVKEVE